MFHWSSEFCDSLNGLLCSGSHVGPSARRRRKHWAFFVARHAFAPMMWSSALHLVHREPVYCSNLLGWPFWNFAVLFTRPLPCCALPNRSMTFSVNSSYNTDDSCSRTMRFFWWFGFASPPPPRVTSSYQRFTHHRFTYASSGNWFRRSNSSLMKAHLPSSQTECSEVCVFVRIVCHLIVSFDLHGPVLDPPVRECLNETAVHFCW